MTGSAFGGKRHLAPVGLQPADRLQQRQRLGVLALARLGGRERDPQHPQRHVRRLDRAPACRNA